MWGNSALMSGCMQKALSYTKVGFMSWTTLNSIMTWCMHITEPLSQDSLDNGRRWKWCCRTTGGQGCPDMLPSSLLSQFVPPDWVTNHVTGQVTFHRHFRSLFMFVFLCLVTCPFLETVYSSHAKG